MVPFFSTEQVGSWANPTHHHYYADGNVLCWSELLPYRLTLPHLHNAQVSTLTNSITNISVIGAGEAISCLTTSVLAGQAGRSGLQLQPIPSVPGRYRDHSSILLIPYYVHYTKYFPQTYQHSGNTTFLQLAYQFYKELFWDGISGKHWLYAYDSVLSLNAMAAELGCGEDAEHWNTTVRMDLLQHKEPAGGGNLGLEIVLFNSISWPATHGPLDGERVGAGD